MTFHRVNIDYEFELFDKKYSPFNKRNKLFCEEFEFVYFFMEQGELKLSTDRIYDQNYLSYLEKILNKKINVQAFDLSVEPWWGRLDSLDIERKNNSKRTSYEFAKKLNLLPDNVLYITKAEDISLLNKELKYLVKNPFLMSGRGQSFFDYTKIPDFPFLLEEYHKIDQDFGFRVNFEEGIVYCVELFNLNGKQFSGGKYVDIPDFVDPLILKEIASLYFHNKCKESIQIDCYSYDNNFRYLVEANYRKTMGDFIYSLHKNFDHNPSHKGLYVENVKFNSFSEMCLFLGDNLYSLGSNKGVIPCSPPGNLKTWFYRVE
jgi:hypothetical protein